MSPTKTAEAWDIIKDYTNSQGLLIVLSGPGGAGKDTLVRILKKTYINLHYVVTVTTRPQRTEEIDWEHYHFVSDKEFDSMIRQDEFLEWVQFFDYRYGTPKKQVMDAVSSGKDVVLKIETQGAKTLREMIPEAVFVFLTTGSELELRQRLHQRADLTPERQEKRVAIASDEMKCLPEYDYLIVNSNDTAFIAAEKLKYIIEAEHLRVGRKSIHI
ncbi:guanylate kinase [Candidatus Wirthbacteria bacterium CG2_30_54_11]|uniref:Guanylate kinase n=1 Tax=Candidatus Wirthbacteria bacterium CG2_30_54_11 TaxID=1817892 RepID=A0A1J5IHV3_9BACT|nr:MAG: guanylate kinase [Candidatus Wirthbacteria bacterium CG2_30_54_11]